MSELITRTVGPKSAKKSLRKAFKSRRPLFLWGSAGVGKSDIIKQLGYELDAYVIDVRLSLWEPTDIKGIPYFDATQNTMVWAPPAELPSQEFAAKHKQIILFLDEMNSAAPSVQAAAYQLVLNRRVGQYVLPDNVVIVAAGNRDSDRGVTYRMPAPLANRFVHLEIAVDWDDWFEWATSNNTHVDVVGFLGSNKQDLHNFDPKSTAKAFATPRSWSFVSELLDDDDTDESTLHDLVAGSVGEGLAVKFMAHKRMTHKLPKPEDILSGKVTTVDTKEISALYSLAVGLCYELKVVYDKKLPNWDTYANNYFKFIMENMEVELAIMAAKIVLSNYQMSINACEIECMELFLTKYGKYIIATR